MCSAQADVRFVPIADIAASIRSPRLFRNRLARNCLVVIGMCHLRAPGFSTRHDFKARVEVDHGRGKLVQDACVALHLRSAVGNLSLERFCTHHRLLQIGAIDREGQVGLFGLITLDVGERGVLQLDDELLAVVRRDEVDCEPHAFSLAAVHADAQEVEEQFGGHRADHVGAA